MKEIQPLEHAGETIQFVNATKEDSLISFELLNAEQEVLFTGYLNDSSELDPIDAVCSSIGATLVVTE